MFGVSVLQHCKLGHFGIVQCLDLLPARNQTSLLVYTRYQVSQGKYICNISCTYVLVPDMLTN